MSYGAVEKVVIRKDSFIPSRPWCADVIWNDGLVWRNWAYQYRTRKALVAHVEAVAPGARIEFAE